MFCRCMIQWQYSRCCALLLCAVLVGLGGTFLACRIRYHGAYWAYVSLMNLSEGLRQVNEEHGHLPLASAEDPTHGVLTSWRVRIYQAKVRPALRTRGHSEDVLHSTDYRVDKPWNDPQNALHQDAGRWLFNYTRNDTGPAGQHAGAAGVYTTYYKAIKGRDTAFDNGKLTTLQELPDDLILVVRVEHSDTHWMEPGDIDVRELRPTEATRRLLLGDSGYVVLFADGEGWVLSPDTPLSHLCVFFTIAGANQHRRRELLRPYRVFP